MGNRKIRQPLQSGSCRMLQSYYIEKPYDRSCFPKRARVNTGDQGISLHGSKGNVMFNDTNVAIFAKLFGEHVFLVEKIFISLKIVTHAEHDQHDC